MNQPWIGVVQAGGGSKCAWEAGIWQYLAEAGTFPQGIHFVAGTSGGALNALPLASHAPGPGQLHAAARMMTDLWRSIQGPRDVFRLRFPPLLAAAWSPSICRTEPLYRLLQASFDPAQIRRSGVQLRLTGVDLLSGRALLYDQDHPELLLCALASAAFPGAFPPVKLGRELVTDGGVREAAPLGAAIDAGCERILVLLPTDPDMPSPMSKEEAAKTFRIVLRIIDLMHAEVVANDLAVCKLVNRLVDAQAAPGKRRVELDLLTPSVPLGSGAVFDPDEIARRIDQGYADADAYFSA